MLHTSLHVGRAVTTLALCALCAHSVAQVLPSATEPPQIDAKLLVERADEVRFPKGGFEMEVTILSSKPNEEKDERRYRVLSRGGDNSIVQVLEPAADRGQAILMKGRDLWMYVPDVSQPIRLSLAQRLTGQVANGDLARTNFSIDYDATVLRTESIAGVEHVVLELTAKERSVTYAKVIAWINRANFHTAKAEFYAVSGRLLKTAHYQNYKPMLGRLRPTRMTLIDAVKKNEESVMDYVSMKQKDLPDRVFSKENLRRLD